MEPSRLALSASAALCLLQAARAASSLPDRVASHFGPSGLPDAWASKASFLAVYVGVVAVMSATTFLAARWISRLPDDAINLPNKDYWLAPERRGAAIGALAGRLAWFGAATNLLLLDVFGQAIEVGLGRAGRLDHAALSLGLYVLFTVVWLAALVRRFAKPA